MKEIKLISMEMENFKNFEKKSVVFDGADMKIYGKNELGKSTHYDAFCWCLFGKSAKWETGMDVKPRNKDGSLRAPGAQTKVELLLSIDGEEKSFARVFYERWQQQRGSSERTYSGNTTDFAIDGYPMSAGEYKAAVGELCDEKSFRVLSSVYGFTSFKWNEQREILFDMISPESDFELACAENERFGELAPELANHSLEEIRKKLEKERKLFQSQKEAIPTRIDECQKKIMELNKADFEAEKQNIARLADIQTDLMKELASLECDSALIEKKSELRELQAALAALEKENTYYRQASVNDSSGRDLMIFRERREILVQSVERTERTIRNSKNSIEFLTRQINAKREEWEHLNEKEFSADAVCPTCKRAYPEEDMEKRKAQFESEKRGRLDLLAEEGQKLSEHLKAESDELEALKKELKKRKSDLKEIEEKICNAEEEEAKAVADAQDMPLYAEKHAKLETDIAEKAEEILKIETESASLIAEKKEKIRQLDRELCESREIVAGEGILTSTRSRITELEKEARALSAEIEERDRRINLCEEFLRFKVSRIEDSINDEFAITRFKLFHEQVNGGIAECCEAMKDGVLYSDLNDGSKVKVGMDIISALARHYGFSLPLFIDNAESVTDFPEAGTQTIQLIVSEKDKELRYER